MIGRALEGAYPLPKGAAEKFDRFHALLEEWNQRMDLTNISGEDALDRHYIDSLSALSLLDGARRAIDIGTGAGFPGMPLALALPDVSFTLLDALKKRTLFLHEAVDTLGIQNVQPVHARVEDFARENLEGYDIAVSRAVAALPVLIEWAMPLLTIGGRCVFWKGPEAHAELPEAARVSALLGGGAPEIIPAEVKGRSFVHVIIQKHQKTDAKFPRKAGMAVKRPL